nr:MAG TPA: hypothetical protein [Crassvirales sp.]
MSSRFGSHSENHLKNFEHRSIYLCTILPLRTPSGSQLLCWYPRWYMLFPVRERWVPQRCGHPTAEHSERHTS